MNPAQYLMNKIRICRHNTEHKYIREGKTSCFLSIGSATHNYHGDDAVGYGPGYMVVADGVSGTLKASGILARVLVSETLVSLAKLKKRACDTQIKASDFSKAIQNACKIARKATKRKGRLDSTVSAVYFDEHSRRMFVYTIGDCKSVLVREGKVVFESDSLVYDFNVPAVVSNNDSINYSAEVEVQSCSYESGDVCLLFSDGVHDNLFADQVLAAVGISKDDASDIANKTVEMVKEIFTECQHYIPFAVSAAGFCLEAIEELKTNPSVDPKEYSRFLEQCKSIPAAEVKRNIFGKERRVRKLAFYSASNLLAFAHKSLGKKDDVSVCAAVLA